MRKIKLFIDGGHGTTGLKIRDLLKCREDIELIEIASDLRKKLEARLDMYNQADLTIMCLPDEASREIVSHLKDINGKILDTSSAFRTNEDWAYGLAELGDDCHQKIISSQKTANPGCYPTGFNLLIRPLIKKNVLDAGLKINCFAVSGYSGGGRKMIEEFEQNPSPEFFFYSLDSSHKHLPEMQKHSGLNALPGFNPSVTNVYNGMIVTVALDKEFFGGDVSSEELFKLYRDFYGGKPLIRVREPGSIELEQKRLQITLNQNTNFVDLFIFFNRGYFFLAACLDNLGKGAAGAAVQNLNLMTGKDEYTGLF